MGLEGDVITLNDVFRFEYDGESPDGTLRGRYYCSHVRPAFVPRLAYYKLEQAWMAALAEAGP